MAEAGPNRIQNEYDRGQVWLYWNHPSSASDSAIHKNPRFSSSFIAVCSHSWRGGMYECMSSFTEFLLTLGDRRNPEQGVLGWGEKMFECRLSIYLHVSWTKLLMTMNSNCFNSKMRIMTTAYFTRLLEISSLVMIVKVLHKLQKNYIYIFGIICDILSSLLRCWWAYLTCTRTTWKTC